MNEEHGVKHSAICIKRETFHAHTPSNVHEGPREKRKRWVQSRRGRKSTKAESSRPWRYITSPPGTKAAGQRPRARWTEAKRLPDGRVGGAQHYGSQNLGQQPITNPSCMQVRRGVDWIAYLALIVGGKQCRSL
ncbi:hypothetical protein B0I35DRAFT_39857 [Stachybotrys elegans]|uniref:Uncharacterized protein n=1 Tax=Stachybotrys elegans TaxID=80388 RepID=A0A8K0WX10_9HYPO|nr:hypothetical protein B0I35DRAFT_39857 [Stachybotrys elegans]